MSWPQGERGHGVIEAVAAAQLQALVPDFADLVRGAARGAALRRSREGRDSRTVCSAATSPSTRRWPHGGRRLHRAQLAISDEAAFAGIASARWPSRFGSGDTAPLTMWTGGHNPRGPRPGRLCRRSSGGGGTRFGRLCLRRAGPTPGLPGYGARRGAIGP